MEAKQAETPQTLWEASFAYAIAVSKLTANEADPHGSDISLPCFMLSGFALELAGKAYLRHHRDDKKTGHDLRTLYARVSEHGLVIPPLIAEGLDSLAPWHEDHSFRYMRPGFVAQLPNLETWPAVLYAFVRDVACSMAGSETAVERWLHLK